MGDCMTAIDNLQFFGLPWSDRFCIVMMYWRREQWESRSEFSGLLAISNGGRAVMSIASNSVVSGKHVVA